MVNTGGNDAKSPISPSVDLSVSSGSEDVKRWVKESKDKNNVEILYCLGLFY